MSFIQDAIDGKVTAKDIHKYIEIWHDSSDDTDFYEILGMTPDEYGDYIEAVGHRYEVVQQIIDKYKSRSQSFDHTATLRSKIKRAQQTIKNLLGKP